MVMIALTPGAWAASLGPLPPEADQALARSILKELVEINTTHSYGSTGAAQAIQQHLIEAGYSASDVVLFLGPGCTDGGVERSEDRRHARRATDCQPGVSSHGTDHGQGCARRSLDVARCAAGSDDGDGFQR
jgi:hypothetical protein